MWDLLSYVITDVDVGPSLFAAVVGVLCLGLSGAGNHGVGNCTAGSGDWSLCFGLFPRLTKTVLLNTEQVRIL